jgi:stearoyl-CoA desaturase (Delta-9 desaturase)
MSAREHHGFILVSSVVPLLGVVAAIVLLWDHLVGPSDLIVFAIMYVIAGLGVSAGYHRLLTHRAFNTYRPIRFALVAAGASAGQAPPIIWAAHHRRHHRLADKAGDPHSPYDDGEPGLRGALKGLWHAHMGWLFNRELTSDPLRYCPDLARDRDVRFISIHFLYFVALGIVLPALLGFALTGTLAGAATGALWGGLVRLFVSNHVTYSVNSVGHYFGSRRFATSDESRNVSWLALPSFGEAWHNNHHAFPRSASHGLRWYEPDISAMLIGALDRVGLAWDVVRIDRALQDQRASDRPAHGAPARAPFTDRTPGLGARPEEPVEQVTVRAGEER